MDKVDEDKKNEPLSRKLIEQHIGAVPKYMRKRIISGASVQ